MSAAKSFAPTTLHDSKVEYQSLMDRITDGFFAIDKNWNYIFLNKQAAKIGQREISDLLGKNIWEEFPEAVNLPTYKVYHEAMDKQRYMSNIDYYAPLDLWFENHVYPSREGISVFIKDITERKKLEQELLERTRSEKAQVTAAALHAQEKERNAIGIELHDNVNQILVAAKLLMTEAFNNPAKSSQLIPLCLQGIDNAITENRRIAHGLVSPDLTIENLLGQVKRLKTTMLSPSGIKAAILHEHFEEHRLNDEQKLAIYRIVQEQCTNIIKHAQAKNVAISLETRDNELSMCISDDGVGTDQNRSASGNGLRNISGRVNVLNGEMIIESSPGAGFSIEIQFPLVTAI